MNIGIIYPQTDQGGSHAAVSTMGQGRASIGAHLDYIAEVAEVMKREGLF